MPHPRGTSEGVRLSALACIVVNPEPAQAVLTRPESIYLLDSMGSVAIPWSVDNYNNQTTTLTVIRVTGDDQPTTDPCTLSGGSGIYTLNLSQVADGALKDTYQIMLSVDNGSYESPSTDSFPLYVYNADALKIVGSEDQPITELTLDNTDKVSGDLPTDTTEILAMRQELGLLDYIGINYGGRDEIARAAEKLVQENLPVTVENINSHLDTAGMHDPDIIVRCAGEKRLSNFMLWQASYAEFISMNVLWPDFTRAHLDEAILEFCKRNRRFGGL